MRYEKQIIGFLTAFLMGLLIFVLVVCGDDPIKDHRKTELSLKFMVRSGDNQEEISCWEHPEGGFYVFLPGYSSMEDVFVASVDGREIFLGEIPLNSGMPCDAFDLNREYTVSCSGDDSTLESTLSFVSSGGIPSLYIDVQSGSMDYIHMEKGNEESGTLRLYDTGGEMLYSGTLASVKGRGNASWTADKKPYSLTLSQEADLLNMGVAQKWILLADGDNPINIRNKIVYEFADAFGLPYTPDCEWVDLYLNGSYAGLYLLTERNEVHPQRVDISLEDGFLVSQELEYRLQEQKYPYVRTESGQALRIHAGDNNIQQLQRFWQSVENAILAEDGLDPETGKDWHELIDMDSWARKYLIEEVFGNHDGGCVSQFYYVDGNDKGKKVIAGPVWDYDYAMGGSSVWLRPHYTYLTMDRAFVSETVYAPWYPALLDKQEFQTYAVSLFEEEMLELMNRLLEQKLEEYYRFISRSVEVDSLRWGISLDAVYEDLEEIYSFLRHRTAFLQDMWTGDAQYYIVCVDPGRYGLYGHFAVKDGQTLPELPNAESLGGVAWYDADTQQPIDLSQPIHRDMHLYMKKPDQRIPLIHYLPAAVLVLALPMLAVWEYTRTRKRRRRRNEPTEIV